MASRHGARKKEEVHPMTHVFTRRCRSFAVAALLAGCAVQPDTGILMPDLRLLERVAGGSAPASRDTGGPALTAAQVFDDMVKRMEKERQEVPWDRRTHALNPYLMLETKVEDWLATEEGRFAHAIKIPNPVPADSGYRPGMTQQEYFEHLCRNEAGEFVFKTVDDVEGLYQIRPRRIYHNGEMQHLYALEDPYGYWVGEWDNPGFEIVQPDLWKYFEIHPSARRRYEIDIRQFYHASVLADTLPGATIARFSGYNNFSRDSMRLEFDTKAKARYGFTWRGVKRPMDRELGIAGGELIVLDLQTMEVMGVRRGYNVWNRGWTGRVCPRYGYIGGQDKATTFTAWFVAKVARPSRWKEVFAMMERGRRVVGNPNEQH